MKIAAFVKFLGLFCVFALSYEAKAQTSPKFYKEILLRSDTNTYSTQNKYLDFNRDKYLFFKARSTRDIFEVLVYIDPFQKWSKIKLLPSTDFNVVDSLIFIDQLYYRAKIKFLDLENNRNPSLLFEAKRESGEVINSEIHLAPYYETNINLPENDEIELFQEEEKTIELPAENVYNVHSTADWIEGLDFDYKLSPSINALKVQIRPHTLGNKTFLLKLKTLKPFLNENNSVSYDLPTLRLRFNVKPNRLDYLNPDKHLVYFNADYKSSEEIQFDFNRNFILRKTYRIEDQQESGGNLIAELYTQSQVANSNKVICRLRTFALHRINEGYLYIKDGDKTRFITNFNIIEKPRIDEVSILHEGEDWINNLSLNPGEKVELRVKGTGLEKSQIQFDGADGVVRDTVRNSDEVIFYTIHVPNNIPKKKVNIFMNKRSTQYSLFVREYQTPTDLDFIKVNYGEKDLPLTNPVFNKPIFYQSTIKDINFTFDPNKIDEFQKINGKQYIDIEIKILNARNDLIEIQKIEKIALCPGDNSPRSSYYDIKDCRVQGIDLNDYLIHKTYNLDPFSQIYITVKHSPDKYSSVGYSKQIKMILHQRINFDIDVSFPAGLITKKFNESGFSSLGGISIAAVGQFKFAKPDQLRKFKPYTLGAGFIAINAFNLSNDAKRDLGIVVLGTVTPLLTNSKLSFPLYLGGGYLLQADSWFVLIGPGLRINF